MPINSRAKGAKGERELAKILKEYGYNCRRGQQYSGLEGEDIKNIIRENFRRRVNKWEEM